MPDFGVMAPRPRVLTALRAFGCRPVLLFGPSGSGKSVAASQYCAGLCKQTIWIDAHGAFFPANRVVSLVSSRLGGARPESPSDPVESMSFADLMDRTSQVLELVSSPDGLVVVLDDVHGPDSRRASHEIIGLARTLLTHNSQLLVTARDLSAWQETDLCEFGLIGGDDLALDADEARNLLLTAGYPSLVPDVEQLRSLSAGHPALFVVLSSQASRHGLDSDVSRVASLDAWIERLLRADLSPDDIQVLLRADLLLTGRANELKRLGVEDPNTSLLRIANELPLVVVERTRDGRLSFAVHDLVDGFLADRGNALGFKAPLDSVREAIAILTRKGEYGRAAELMIRFGEVDQVADWLTINGHRMFTTGYYGELGQLLELVPVHTLMIRHQLLVIWAELATELGQQEEALARCRAARTLAEHAGDTQVTCDAISLSLSCLRRTRSFDEAEALAAEVLETPVLRQNIELRIQALICIGHARLDAGKGLVAARAALQEAITLAKSIDVDTGLHNAAILGMTAVEILASGDFVSAGRELSPLVENQHQLLSTRVMTRGNLAACLAETGRAARSEALARSAISAAEDAGLDVYAAAYAPVLGCALAATGSTREGLTQIKEGILKSLDVGDRVAADQGRVYLAVVLRASGQAEESLSEAEQAFEQLSVSDSMNFRELAALEVAASLLALDDHNAARAWVESIAQVDESTNGYRKLRADMILAEIDRREGRLGDGSARIERHLDHIATENSNWQMAMYCRAFPELMAMLASAITVPLLPAHMLRMLPPEDIERILIRTRDLMPQGDWEELGDRLLGGVGFAEFIARDGLPLCHVRLFGGLEINVGGRLVRERDWKKRKARLLFAMLATKRGQDVPRDQVFEYLWPDMEPERAKNNLYVVWSLMKSVLSTDHDKGGKSPYVESVGGVCRVLRQAVRSDLDDFEDYLVLAKDAEVKQDAEAAVVAYERLAHLYRGDLLPGDVYDDWFSGLRDHYRIVFVDAMVRATQQLLDADDPVSALVFARRALQTDSLREDLCQWALRCQIAAGQRSAAIDTYFQFRSLLADELGLDPSPETRSLYEEILVMENAPRSMFD